ncbi:ABC transporter ATP-binding protein [Agreia pratensis]|nr:ABC transporter ATP-binding protein [Microbacterium sp. VKM Ac-2870]MBF4633886.1 ABC transporter ATP-binding protein [Agreia pratensis]
MTVDKEPYALEAVDLRKSFTGVVANERVSLRLRPGSIHAVMGENGAGKSTLMNLLYGALSPDAGRLLVQGTEVTFHSPRDAISAGIGMVHQHFALADNLTVLENLILGDEPRRLGAIQLDVARARAEATCDEVGISLDLDARVGDLNVADRQRVEIVKALGRGARILILDEPTAVLVPSEVDRLFSSLRKLVKAGLAILFISHKLDEVLGVADEITVIRRGVSVAESIPREKADRSSLATLMVGQSIGEIGIRRRGRTMSEVPHALEVCSVSLPASATASSLSGIEIRVAAGEIVGVAGIEGNGQTELIDVICGLRRDGTGRVRVDGVTVNRLGPTARRRSGLAIIPEDRHRQGLLLGAPLWENRILGWQSFAPNSRHGFIDRSAAKADTRRLLAKHDVRAGDVDVRAAALSGGNQQKLIVGRELASEPRALVAAHPTRGVDIAAQHAIWSELIAHTERGMGTLLISADLDELLYLSDRIIVLFEGRIVAEMEPSSADAVSLGLAMTGAAA